MPSNLPAIFIAGAICLVSFALGWSRGVRITAKMILAAWAKSHPSSLKVWMDKNGF